MKRAIPWKAKRAMARDIARKEEMLDMSAEGTVNGRTWPHIKIVVCLGPEGIV